MDNNIKNTEDTSLTFANLALALANDYTSLYVINTDDSYVELSPVGCNKELKITDSGDDFYSAVPHNCRRLVYKEDQQYFLDTFKKENVIRALENGHSFSITYRLMIDGSPRYFFLKTIKSGNGTIIIGVQDVHEQKMREEIAETYSHIAGALASRYEVLYYVNIETNEYKQYSASTEYAKLGTATQGKDFFVDARNDIAEHIHNSDATYLLHELEKDRLLDTLHHSGSATFRYRMLLDGRQQYMSMVVVKPKDDDRHIVMGVLNVDEQMRHENMLASDSRTFGNIALALAQRYEVIYHVNVVTNEYTEYSASEEYSKLKVGATGSDFFAESLRNMETDIYPDDRPMMREAIQKERLMKNLEKYGKTFLNYRLMLGGKPQYVTLYAVRPKDITDHIIVAVANVDSSKRMELAYYDAIDMANRDSLTGVKNKRAYAQMEMDIDKQINSHKDIEFAVIVCDINGLKNINDTKGHKTGDEFIKNACRMICTTFTHSPVFRIGGDEFAVILKGSDYDERVGLMEQLGSKLDACLCNGTRVLAGGISEYDPEKDIRLQDVFERADAFMYEDKKKCKASCR
ncbi:MAG: GGDEF domain-containing protein [Ruminococcus sp.]|nr:GGDEF domain-containing protein [Ruminococcus sp.]